VNIYDSDWINIDGNFVHRTAIIGDGVIMGKGNIIYPYSVIGFRGAIRNDSDDGARVRIGDNNRIFDHTSIKHNVTIGNRNLIMSYVNIGHDCLIGNDNEIGAKTLLCGHVIVGNKNMIKVAVNVRNRVRIHDGVFIAMGSNVVKEVISGSVLKGNPAR